MYSGQSKKTARSTMAQITQQCQDMTAKISVSSVFDEMTTASMFCNYCKLFAVGRCIGLYCRSRSLRGWPLLP